MGRARQTGEPIRYAGDGPIITIAPTGAGKSSGPVICNALTHPGQLVCLDVKGKVYEATADRRRQMGQEVYKIDLRDTFDSDALNPLDLARRTGSDIDSIARALAAEMVERTGKENDRYWIDTAETMIAGGLSYLWHHLPRPEHNFEKLFNLYTGDDTAREIAVLMDTVASMNRATHAAWATFLCLPETTRGCVLSSTVEHLRLFGSATVNRCIRTTSCDLDALLAGDPISIYVIVPPYRMAALRPLLRLIVSSLLNFLFMRDASPAHRTLMLVDEAYQLGRLDALLTASTLGREYGITLHTIWQNAAQMDIYDSQARTIIDNAGAFQCFGMRNLRMANEIAALLGGLTGEELMAMEPDEMLLAMDGYRPTIVKQVRYYRDAMFAGMYPSGIVR